MAENLIYHCERSEAIWSFLAPVSILTDENHALRTPARRWIERREKLAAGSGAPLAAQ